MSPEESLSYKDADFRDMKSIVELQKGMAAQGMVVNGEFSLPGIEPP